MAKRPKFHLARWLGRGVLAAMGGMIFFVAAGLIRWLLNQPSDASWYLGAALAATLIVAMFSIAWYIGCYAENKLTRRKRNQS